MIIKTWNCTGLPSKVNTAKFRSWLADADIAGLQETFLDTCALQVSGFCPFIKTATPAPAGKNHRATGGLVTLVSSQLAAAYEIECVDPIEFDGFENLCIRFTRRDASRADLPHSFFIFNCYVLAQPAKFDFLGLFFALEAYLLALDAPVVLLGDFNAHWHLARGTLPNPRDRDFREFVVRLGDIGFAHYPSAKEDLRFPTFISAKGSTIIDYFFVRGVSSSGFGREHLTEKGHRALRLSLDWPRVSTTILRERTSWRKHFRSSPPPSFFPSLVDGYSLYSAADMIRSGISQVFALFVLCLGSLFTSGKPPDQIREPWHRYLSAVELAPLFLLEREVFSLVAGAELGEPPLGLNEKTLQLRQLRKTLHSLATRRLFEDVKGSYSDPTRLWSFVRRFRTQPGQEVLPIDALVTHFTSVFNRMSDPLPIVFCENFYAISDDVLDVPFTMGELEVAVKSLDKSTAPGAMGIGNEILIELFQLPGGPQFFLDFFNACFDGGRLPDLWRRTEIFLLYKGKGDIVDPSSYRGIALMESSLKLYEKLLFNRLMPWSSAHGLLPDCQFGFRPRSSTLDAVFVLFAMITKYVLFQSGSLFVALIDFQKAFPSVHRGQLLAKLGSLGVSSRFCRGVASTFEGNTFCIRQGARVTCDFPVITGLREGSVLSPLLFILFMSDIQCSVLRPFSKFEFLKRDPELNGVPIPGLLYADDLVLMCLTSDLLRERLRRLSDYAYSNTLTVNVSKCEVVVFGDRLSRLTFKYQGKPIPIRQSCKYLGVWLDFDLSGKALADSVLTKFKAAIPVFFSLCRRLRLGRLDVVYRLANALVFSLLYGCEFLRKIDVVEKCEAAWWSGVRAFYGLPPGVSAVFVRFLFPRFSLVNRIYEAKFNLLRRGTLPLPTLFPEAVIFDRGFLFPKAKKGYSQILFDWCTLLGSPELIYEYDRNSVRAKLLEKKSAQDDRDWLLFSEMESTKFAASLFQSRSAVYSILFEASKFTKLGVRAVMLSLSGALSFSYSNSRSCVCGSRLSCEHFLTCPSLGHDLVPLFRSLVESGDWREISVLLLTRFHVYLHAIRGGELTRDENDLFDCLFADVSDDVTPVADIFG